MEYVRSIFKNSARGPSRPGELWGSLFDLWFLLPLLGLMVGSEKGGDAHLLGRELLFLGAAWALSALLFRTPLPLQPLKVWAFLFLILRPTPLEVSVASVILGLLLFGSGRSGLAARLEGALSQHSFEGARRAVGFYVRAIGVLSLGSILLHGFSGFLPPALGRMIAEMVVPSPGPALCVLLLVLPQVPVTLINGVLSTVRERRECGGLSGEAMLRLTGTRVSEWVGAASLAAGTLGLLPFCHGSGGLWIYRRQEMRTILPSLVSSAVLSMLGGGVLAADPVLPGPEIPTVFLSGFLLTEFFLKWRGRRKDPAVARGRFSERHSRGPLEICLLFGGMVSGAIALGGLPLALFFLAGINAAMACSSGSFREGALFPPWQSRTVFRPLASPGEKTPGILAEDRTLRSDMDGPPPGAISPEGNGDATHSPGFGKNVLRRLFFGPAWAAIPSRACRRAREILCALLAAKLFCLFYFFLAFLPAYRFTVEVFLPFQRLHPFARLSPRAP